MDDSAIAILLDSTHAAGDPNAHYDDSNTTRYYYYDTPVAGMGATGPGTPGSASVLQSTGESSVAALPQVVKIKDGSGRTTDQFVWGPAYVAELPHTIDCAPYYQTGGDHSIGYWGEGFAIIGRAQFEGSGECRTVVIVVRTCCGAGVREFSLGQFSFWRRTNSRKICTG